MAAAKAWTTWEMSTSYADPNVEYIQKGGDPVFAAAFARIESHYFVNGGFFANETQLLDRVDRIRHIPTVIVQGRRAVVCPMKRPHTCHSRCAVVCPMKRPHTCHSRTRAPVIVGVPSSSR